LADRSSQLDARSRAIDEGAIAVVGLGRMGSRIALRLLGRGHAAIVWNRSPDKARALIDRGASPAASPAEAARRASVVITMVSDPEALRVVTEGADGIANGADASTTLIEMSTVGPEAISRLRSTLPAGAHLVDAPVLGSVDQAEQGSLRIFVGGEASSFGRVRTLLSELGSVMHVGALGSGAAAKLVANLGLLGTLGLLGEAAALGRGLGLADPTIFEVLSATPLAAQAERRRPAIERGEYPARFALPLARKDADLITAAAASFGADLRIADAARSWLAEAERATPDLDYSAVLAFILGRH
jgi:3-hydroxyisobutyrate dehydrogenase-like beta-hydroxyacid dehydrogenase